MMDRKQSSGVQVGNLDMGECFCKVKCRLGHETRLLDIGRLQFVACDMCRRCVFV